VFAGAALGATVARPVNAVSQPSNVFMFAVAVALGWVGWSLNRRRSVVLEIPLCSTCDERWRSGVRTWIVCVLTMHGLALGAFAASLAGSTWIGALGVGMIVMLGIVALVENLPARFVRTRVRRANVVVIAGVDARARGELLRIGEANPHAARPR
jgi:hypothetical protein